MLIDPKHPPSHDPSTARPATDRQAAPSRGKTDRKSVNALPVQRHLQFANKVVTLVFNHPLLIKYQNLSTE